MESIKALTSQTAIPWIMADQDGFIIRINPKFEEIFHWPARDLVGQLITAIIPSSLRDAHHLGFSRFLTTETPTLLNQSIDLEIILGNGDRQTARHFIVAEKPDGNWVFAARIEPME